MHDWTTHPLERARYLDGEGSPAERAERAASLLRDPSARARVDADARVLAVFRRGVEARPEPSALLEARIRRALAADRAAGFPSTGAGDAHRVRRRRLVAAAAATLALLGGAIWSAATDRAATATAHQDAVRLAAEAYRDAVVGVVVGDAAPGGGCDDGVASPHRFPLVTSGDLSVETCREVGTKAVAVVHAAGRAQAERGLVVMPTDGKSVATDVGFTRVDDVVVFDVAIGRAKYYLATRYEAVDGTPMCAACHGSSRADHPERNPHRFFERAPVLLRPAR